MPRGDRSGPQGWGPRTGRGLGYCAGYSNPGYTKGMGMGWGRGRGYGRGWAGGGGWGRGRGYYPIDPPPFYLDNTRPWSAPFAPEKEAEYLQDLIKNMKNEIEHLEKRIIELSEKNED